MDFSKIKKKFEDRQNLTFYILSILMFVLVVLCAYYSISYLAIKTTEGLKGNDNIDATPIKFNIEEIKALRDRKTQN